MSSFPHEIQGLNNVFSKFFLEEQRQKLFLVYAVNARRNNSRKQRLAIFRGGGQKRAKITKGDGEKFENGETERKERKLGPGRVVCPEGERKRERDEE